MTKTGEREFNLVADPKRIEDAIEELEQTKLALEAMLKEVAAAEVKKTVERLTGDVSGRVYSQLEADTNASQVLADVTESALRGPMAKVEERLSLLRDLLRSSRQSCGGVS